MLIREMRSEDKPRERFQISPRLASNTDLVAILLRTGRQGHSVMEIAKEVVDLLERETGINGYEDLNWRDLTDIKGIGPDKAVTICAAVELGRRLSLICDKRKLVSFSAPDKVAAFFMEKTASRKPGTLRHGLCECEEPPSGISHDYEGKSERCAGGYQGSPEVGHTV